MKYLAEWVPKVKTIAIGILLWETWVFSVCAQSLSCPTLGDLMDHSPLGSSVHGIFQARIWKWVAISSSWGSSPLRDQTLISCISCIAVRFFTLSHRGSWYRLSGVALMADDGYLPTRLCHGLEADFTATLLFHHWLSPPCPPFSLPGSWRKFIL